MRQVKVDTAPEVVAPCPLTPVSEAPEPLPHASAGIFPRPRQGHRVAQPARRMHATPSPQADARRAPVTCGSRIAGPLRPRPAGPIRVLRSPAQLFLHPAPTEPPT